jgi:hypothetical protein
MNKVKLSRFFGSLIFLFLCVVVGAYAYYAWSPPLSAPISQIESSTDASYVANFDDERVLVGYAQNVFVGKVTSRVGSQARNGVPHSQFEVAVIQNIKGNIQGSVVVDLESDSGDMGAVILGATYVFTARHIPELSPFYHVGGHQAFRSIVSDNANLTTLELDELLRKDGRVHELLKAYPDEIVRDRDVQRGYAMNSFQSLSPEAQQAVYDKIRSLE